MQLLRYSDHSCSYVTVFTADFNDRNQRTLFVKNLPWTATEDQVAELFEGCTSVRLPLNEEGRLKG